MAQRYWREGLASASASASASTSTLSRTAEHAACAGWRAGGAARASSGSAQPRPPRSASRNVGPRSPAQLCAAHWFLDA